MTGWRLELLGVDGRSRSVQHTRIRAPLPRQIERWADGETDGRTDGLEYTARRVSSRLGIFWLRSVNAAARGRHFWLSWAEVRRRVGRRTFVLLSSPL